MSENDKDSEQENNNKNSNEDNQEQHLSAKVVLLGETAVGKSCLISRFVDNKFQENFTPTMSGCFSSKEFFIEEENKTIKFEVWDTAGQEKYRSMNKLFYQDSAVAILVFDLTRKDSFEAIKNYWYTEVRDNTSKNIIITLAGNKSDLYEYEEVDKEEVSNYAKEINAFYKEVSALDGSGINELFKYIGLKIVDPTVGLDVLKNLKKRKRAPIKVEKHNENENKDANSNNANKNPNDNRIKINNNNNNNSTVNKKKGGCC